MYFSEIITLSDLMEEQLPQNMGIAYKQLRKIRKQMDELLYYTEPKSKEAMWESVNREFDTILELLSTIKQGV